MPSAMLYFLCCVLPLAGGAFVWFFGIQHDWQFDYAFEEIRDFVSEFYLAYLEPNLGRKPARNLAIIISSLIGLIVVVTVIVAAVQPKNQGVNFAPGLNEVEDLCGNTVLIGVIGYEAETDTYYTVEELYASDAVFVITRENLGDEIVVHQPGTPESCIRKLPPLQIAR